MIRYFNLLLNIQHFFIVQYQSFCIYFYSGSSTNSTSLAHSFSVDEIQKIRTRLKCSKSYPDDFLEQKENPAGDGEQDGANTDTNVTRNETAGDNSSSGVSSDQEGADINSKGKKNLIILFDTIIKINSSRTINAL